MVKNSLNGPADIGLSADCFSNSSKAFSPCWLKTRSDSSENNTASPSKAIRNCCCYCVCFFTDGNKVAAAKPCCKARVTSSGSEDKNKSASNAFT